MNDLSIQFQQVLVSLFQFDSVWSVVLRLLLWIAIGVAIIASVEMMSRRSKSKSFKANLGAALFILVIVITALFIYVAKKQPDAFPWLKMFNQTKTDSPLLPE